MSIYFATVITFLITLGCIYLIKPVASHIGLVDLPDHRKQHHAPTPLVGGIAIVLSLGIGLLLLDISLITYRAFLAGMVLMTFVGLLDDLRELTPRIRLYAQVIAGLLMTLWGGVYLHTFGNILFLGEINLGIWGIPVTLFALVCIINAINMIDGLDGLAGGVSWVQVLLLLLFACIEHRFKDAYVLAIIAAAILAFLCFNFPWTRKKKASIFLGDAGSMALGFCLVWFTVSLSQGEGAVAPVVMLWVMIIPIFDFCGVVTLRLLQRKPLMQADRQHIHHWLLGRRLTERTVSIILSSVGLFSGSLAFIAYKIGMRHSILFFVYIFLFIAYLIRLVLPLKNM
ncbi:MAG: rfe [Gammaproteobacteria bacterium]|jgi:UDP-GlcNAc:undecaprenyl-phosphate GlcNAc-1-phosphate transferase|nr:rfe [Gammaproteobacteria bacterium]